MSLVLTVYCFEFDSEEFEILKRRLSGSLKQACLRLGYRANKELQRKQIKHPGDDDDLSQCAEPSEHSTVTDRTSNVCQLCEPYNTALADSVRSDVFYTGDGQWRSGDWSSVGAMTVANRQNSATMARRLRVCMTPREVLDVDYEAKVSAVRAVTSVQTFLPWFLPWILTVLTFLLTRQPTPHELQKQRKERNLKFVRSKQYRAGSRNNWSRGVKAVVPTRSSSLILATSLPVQTRRCSSDEARSKSSVPGQTAGVARVNRMPLTGLPPRPRLIMTPPTSPRSTPNKTEDPRRTSSLPASPSPLQSGLVPQSQSFKILSQSPKKVVIELEKVEQLEGLLSQHFAQPDENKIERAKTPFQDLDEVDTAYDSVFEKQERSLVNCCGRSLEDVASDDVGEAEQESKPPKSMQSRKARAIDILKAKKAKSRELAYSRGSQCSVDSAASAESRKREDNPKEESDGELLGSSISGSLSEEFCGSASTERIPAARTALESWKSFSSSGSSFTIESEVPSMSAQTYELLRRNSRCLSKDLNGSCASTMSKWPSIDEESSCDLTESEEAPIRPLAVAPKEPSIKMTQLPEELWHPVLAPSLPAPGESPFATKARQHPPSQPRPRKTRSSFDTPSPQPAPTPENEPEEEDAPEPRCKKPTRPPPPPPKAKKRLEATNKPPPPPKSASKGKDGKAPPPPPPGSRKRTSKSGSGYSRSSKVIDMFQLVRNYSKGKPISSKRKSKRSNSSDNSSKLSSEGSAGESLIKELENKSSFFANIQSDVENHGAAINKMIQEINTRKFETMTELNAFVKEIDGVLLTFADETAVLKHFEWPHRYYIYREALALWAELNNGREKCRNWTQGSRGITIELDKMKRHMERNIRRMDEVQRTLETEVQKFMRNGVPWDASVLQKVHDGTMTLLEKYMQIVYDEVSRTQTRTSHREKNLTFLTDTINLTFKIHQSVGGLTESCTTLFEKIAALTRTLTDL